MVGKKQRPRAAEKQNKSSNSYRFEQTGCEHATAVDLCDSILPNIKSIVPILSPYYPILALYYPIFKGMVRSTPTLNSKPASRKLQNPRRETFTANPETVKKPEPKTLYPQSWIFAGHMWAILNPKHLNPKPAQPSIPTQKARSTQSTWP